MSPGKRSTQPHLIVDPDRCHACQTCMVACSLIHESRVQPSLARIQIVFDPFGGHQAIHYCHQCRRAPCARACPTDAITWHETTSCWRVDATLCDGCGACAQACPFHAIRVSPETNLAIKCDVCGGQPACAESCPTGAITWSESLEREVAE